MDSMNPHVRVGVIGTGVIGKEHIRRLTHVTAGAEVVAVADVDPARARDAVAGLTGARVHADGLEVVRDDQVDAVVVASWGPTHEEYVLAGIDAGKPVFCEKPLAATQEACVRIIDAELAAGRRLVQVGFMRRYDAAYRALKDVLASGSIGLPLMMHCAHRNPSVSSHYTPDMALTDTAVHEFDVTRWLLDEEIVAINVLTPRPNRRGGELQDPLLILLETENGVLVDVETSVNIGYGYDIRHEVVGEDGTAELGAGSPVVLRRDGGATGPIPADWEERFSGAYEVEMQEWVHSVAAGASSGPTSWDGYAAAVLSDAGMESLRTGAKVAVKLRPKPDLYATRTP
ncbi:Gfo/Idh/MocA family oxidoreductase [Phytoactinopolyspora mesophila]|uniref:Inositol 2-dehydrogenase n=1 Tax=Phytoactinopolyspora mesophila TaxID=2650750 RepID=A0A7K3M1Y1_9ACTN|nr:Gfo/Idh/MocA family oxidoreductase [Phytoactinopolyspora mesophila]NDL56912.1 inositol 2-dehydrogenase [Phytoactinopolyspora mesophila]